MFRSHEFTNSLHNCELKNSLLNVLQERDFQQFNVFNEYIYDGRVKDWRVSEQNYLGQLSEIIFLFVSQLMCCGHTCRSSSLQSLLVLLRITPARQSQSYKFFSFGGLEPVTDKNLRPTSEGLLPEDMFDHWLGLVHL